MILYIYYVHPIRTLCAPYAHPIRTLYAPYSHYAHPMRTLFAHYAHTNMRSILSIIEMSDNIKK